MKLLFFRLVVFLISLSATVATTAQSLRTAALTGSSAPDGMSGDATFGLVGPPALNNSGQVAFLAQLVPAGQPAKLAIFSEGGDGGISLVAADGSAAPGIAGAIYSNFGSARPAINESGQVLFQSDLAIGFGGVTTSNNSAMWITDPNQPPTLVLREGDTVPGTSLKFGSPTSVSSTFDLGFNNLGQVVFPHRLPFQTGVTPSNDSGVWRVDSSGTVVEVARERSGLAGSLAGSGAYGELPGLPSLNDTGEIGFRGIINSIVVPTEEAIWIGQPGSLAVSVEWGMPSPGVSGGAFVDLSVPEINNAGGFAFVGFTDTDVSGIWGKRNTGSLDLFYRGDAEQFHSLGSDATTQFDRLVMNTAGDIAFLTVLFDAPGVGTPGVDPNSNQAIWSEGIQSGLREIAVEGDQPVGLPAGVEFASFEAPTLNAQGQTAFVAELRGDGITLANDRALFAEDDAGQLHLIAREGDVLDVDDGPGVDERVISVLGLWSGTGNEDGRRSSFNDVGQVALAANFTDGSAGVFVSSLVANLAAPGDYNNDGVVNSADYTVWRDSEGQSGAGLAADGNGDGMINGLDYDLWVTNYGSTLPASSTTVPEPSSGCLVLAALYFRLTRRR